MVLRNGARITLAFVDLEDGESTFLASVRLRVEKLNDELLPYEIFVERNLEDVFEIALGVGHDRRV